MRVRHADRKLERLEFDEGYRAGFSLPIINAYRDVMRQIHDAPDERLFYAMKSLHYEKLKGRRSHQQSMRLNKQFRLVIQLEGQGADKTIVIMNIEDYH